MSTMISIAGLDQLDRAVAPADVLQLLPPAEMRSAMKIRCSVPERITRTKRVIDRAFGAVHRLTDRRLTGQLGVVVLRLRVSRFNTEFANLRRTLNHQRDLGAARPVIPGRNGNSKPPVFLSLLHVQLLTSFGS
jgi:hypothetical protein